MVTKPYIHLFTADEHRVLSEFFGVAPPDDLKLPPLQKALARLGFEENYHEYSRAAAATAFVVLEAVDRKLPQWASGAVGGRRVEETRKTRPSDLIPKREVSVLPMHLFTVNWADSEPGVIWPGAYYLTWIPYYQRFVVTESGGSSESFGWYADMALGHFGADENCKEGAHRVVVEEWGRFQTGCQGRWACVLDGGLISEHEVNRWADEVYGGDTETEASEENDGCPSGGRGN